MVNWSYCFLSLFIGIIAGYLYTYYRSKSQSKLCDSHGRIKIDISEKKREFKEELNALMDKLKRSNHKTGG